MDNTEIFDLCETFPRNNAPIVLYIGELALCTAHVEEVWNPREGPNSWTKRTNDALSIPVYVIKKNLTHGAKHGASERQRMHNKAKEMLQKARQLKHGGYKTILERWHKDDKYRKSLSDIVWADKLIIQYDELALEDHSYIATREERTRNEKNWVLSLNQEGLQGPLNQRPDFVETKREWKSLHDEHVKETSKGNTSIHPIQRTRQRRNQQFEGLEENNFQVDPRTGWRSYPSKSQGSLRHPKSSSSSTQWEQHDDWKSNKSWNSWRSSSWTEQWWFFLVQRCCFSLARNLNSLAIVGECRQIHLPHATFSHAQAWYSTDNTCSLAQGSSLSFTRRGHSSTRHVSSCASRYTEHQHKFSPTNISCVTFVLFSEPRNEVHASTYPLWGSTAGWYFHGIPLLHRLWAQKDRAQQYSG